MLFLKYNLGQICFFRKDEEDIFIFPANPRSAT